MRVPFIDLEPTAALVGQAVKRAWNGVIDQREFVRGATVAKFEVALSERLAVQHCIGCASGSDALVVGLRALGVGAQSKVALPNLTFWATYEAVVRVGATPVLIDVDAQSMQMDFAEFVRAQQRFSFDAAILVHLMGWATPQLTAFREYCQAQGVALLEDGAQAYGVEFEGRSVFAGAQLSTLSFHPAKVLGGCMDGGALLTDDAELAALVRKLCDHGRTDHYRHSHVGHNSRLGGLQAAWLLEMLEHDAAIVSHRQRHEEAYRDFFIGCSDRIEVLSAPDGVRSNAYLSVCRLMRHRHETVARRLRELGVSTAWVYPETIDQQSPAVDALRVSELAVSRSCCARLINPPLYFGLSDEQRDYVCSCFVRAMAED